MLAVLACCLSLLLVSGRTGEGEDVLFGKVEEQLVENGFAVEESIKLTGCEDNHVLFVTRRALSSSCLSYQRLKPSRPGYPKRGIGKAVSKVILRRPNLRYPFPDIFAQQLEGQTIGIRRRAKYLLIDADGGLVFLPSRNVWEIHNL